MGWFQNWSGGGVAPQNVVDAVLFAVMAGAFVGVFLRLIEEALKER